MPSYTIKATERSVTYQDLVQELQSQGFVVVAQTVIWKEYIKLWAQNQNNASDDLYPIPVVKIGEKISAGSGIDYVKLQRGCFYAIINTLRKLGLLQIIKEPYRLGALPTDMYRPRGPVC